MKTFQKRLLTVLFLLIAYSYTTTAQVRYMKWGDYTESELNMTVYEPDSSADAVILGKNTTTYFELRSGNPTMIYEIHVKIKVLTKAGLDYATVELPYYSHKKSEKITSVKAQTVNLVNNKKVTTKIKRKEIFNEELSDYVSAKKITFPAAKVGSILEYRYTLVADTYSQLDDFYFQEDIPVANCVVNVRVPEFFTYVVMRQTTMPFDVEDSRSINYNLGVGYDMVDGKEFTLVVKNAPAVREEGFITTMDDYRQRVCFQLRSFYMPGTTVQTYFSDWNSTAKDLMDHPNFGARIRKGRGIKKVAKACPAMFDNSLSKRDKMLAIYTFVQEQMQWNGKNSGS